MTRNLKLGTSMMVLVVMVVLTGCSSDSSASTSLSSVASPTTAVERVSAVDSTTSDPAGGTSPTEVHESSEEDVVGTFASLHEEMIASGGSVLEVVFTDPGSLLEGGHTPAEVIDIVWTAAGSPPEPGAVLEVSTPRGLINTSPEVAELKGFVAIGGEGETLTAGVVDTDGMFIVPDNDAQRLPMAANALARDGIPTLPPSLEEVCAGSVSGRESWNGDAVGALRAYFARFGDESYLELTKTAGNRQELIDSLFTEAGSMTDPVTGVVGQADLNDLAYQLDQGIAPEDVILRPGIPMLITFPQEGDVSQAAVFVAAPSFRVLGHSNMAPVTGERQVVQWIAPPERDETIHVYLGNDDFFGVSCINGGSEPLMEIPWESVAGDTRVAIDLSARTYEEITALP